MSRKLVAYFSASGVTAGAARLLAEAADADLFEIEPEVPYTKADLDWTDKHSRSTAEMNDPSARPAIKNRVKNMDAYDVIFLGFPIWWYHEPSIIDAFLEQYDFSGRTIVLFATSGGSGFGNTAKCVSEKVSPQTRIIEGKMMRGRLDKKKLAAWVNGLNL